MMTNIQKNVIAGAFLVIALLSAFFLWRARLDSSTDQAREPENPLTARQFGVPPEAPRQYVYTPKAPKSADNQANEPSDTAFQPPSTEEIVENLIEKAEDLLPIFPQTHYPSPSPPTPPAENLFPQKYILALSQIQDGLVRADWMKESERTSFVTEEDVFKFLERAVESFVAHGAYRTEEEIQSARYAAQVGFRELWKAERDFYGERKTSALFPWINPPAGGKKNNSELAVLMENKASIVDGLLAAIIPKEALAFSIGVGEDTFVTIPDCWKNIQQGSRAAQNLMALCCNCGLFCSYGCTFYWDCGNENGSKCNVPLGCLNAVCKGDTTAIFDGLPGYEVPATRGWGSQTSPPYHYTCACDR